MIVIGAKGFAIELLEVLLSPKYNYNKDNLFFFDNINEDLPKKLFKEFRILKSFDEVRDVFNMISTDFCIGLGKPNLRMKLSEKFEELGGNPCTIISKTAEIGSFKTVIKNGCCIMGGCRITNEISIGRGVLINLNCTIGHDTIIEDFVEISPGVNISGRCRIGKNTSIGTGSVIIPNITIGENVIIGAGTVVIKDIPDNSVVVGVPGKVIKTN